MSVPSIAIIGTGAVARAIARVHVDAGGRVLAVRSRSAERAAALAGRVGAAVAGSAADVLAADVVVVAVTDRAVAAVGAGLGRALAESRGSTAPVVVHTSGALAGAALGRTLPHAGSLHPLQTFPAPDGGDDDEVATDVRLAARMSGAHWFHEGAGEPEARALVGAWGGEFHALAPGAKALYHAAAAIVSNHTVALFDAATQLLRAAGIPPEDSREPLSVLLRGTLDSLRDVGAPAALTGPVARGDVETVARHMDALQRAAPHLLASYAEMALLALDAAVRRGGVDGATAGRLRRVLAP